MKIKVFLLILLLTTLQVYSKNVNRKATSNQSSATSIGFIIYSNDAETVWNALRLANYSQNKGDTVGVFLLGKGVELDTLAKQNPDIKEQTQAFLNDGGIILGCGTCLQSRNNKDPQVCKYSSMADLYLLVRKNKIVLTF